MSSNRGSIAALNEASKVTSKRANGASAKGKKVSWTHEETSLLVSLPLQAKVDGHWGDNGFKNTAYAIAGNGMADPLKTGGHNGTCQSKWARLKKDYVQVKFVKQVLPLRYLDCSAALSFDPESGVSDAAFPSAQEIGEPHIEVADCEDILQFKSLAVSKSGLLFLRGADWYMCSVDRSNAVLDQGKTMWLSAM